MVSQQITVQTTIDFSISNVWQLYTQPQHIINWNNASQDWHTPRAENDLRAGGKFNFRMESRDGSEGFDFEGTYTKVEIGKLIEYSIADGRKVKVEFSEKSGKTTIKVSFEPEDLNPIEMQRGGWQAILDNFKEYCESI